MTARLLDRQAELLAYLTSAPAIFADRDARGVPEGIDRGVLDLEARFSHQKRMEKIAAVFPRTLQLLESDLDRIVRGFVETCPPLEIGRLANARQFHDFLTSHPHLPGGAPPYMRDLATCELAAAEVRSYTRSGVGAAKNGGIGAGVSFHGRSIRRHPAMRLLRCGYDLRIMFEAGGGEQRVEAPLKHDTHLAFVLAPESGRLNVLELQPILFEVLLALEDWTEPATLGIPPALAGVVPELAASGLIEVGS
jgi:hypothetical protein